MSCCLDLTNGVDAAAGGSSFTQIVAIDIGLLSNVQGAWDFEDDVKDRSGNGLDLDAGVSAVQYSTIQGKRCAYRPGNSAWGRSTHDTELTILGALTCHQLVCVTAEPGTAAWYFSFGAAGATEADNELYSLISQSGSDGDKFVYHSENGAGVDSNHAFDIVPIKYWQLLTLTRNSAGTSVNLYVNGILSGASPGSVTAPTGGTTALFTMHNPSSGTGSVASYVGDMVIQSEELSAAAVLAVAQQVGVAPP